MPRPNDDIADELRSASRQPNDLQARAAQAIDERDETIAELRRAGRRLVGLNALRVIQQPRGPHVGDGVRESSHPYRRAEDGGR